MEDKVEIFERALYRILSLAKSVEEDRKTEGPDETTNIDTEYLIKFIKRTLKRVQKIPKLKPGEFQCQQCGKCCLSLLDAYQGMATIEDITRWKKENREDILEWCDEIGPGMYDIWIHPTTGEDVDRCPWLKKYPGRKKYYCRIHDTKPTTCKDYKGHHDFCQAINKREE